MRSGSFLSLYTIFGTQGEDLDGDGARRIILGIMTAAVRSKEFAKTKETASVSHKLPDRSDSQRSSTNVEGGDEVISEGFKVV